MSAFSQKRTLEPFELVLPRSLDGVNSPRECFDRF